MHGSGEAAEPGLAVRLRRGDALTALLVKMPCAAQIETAAHAGFDLVAIDCEHGPVGTFELEHHLRAAAGAGLPALVRVPSADPVWILQALDAGAHGIVVPHVLDAAGAAAAVTAAHYPPRGRRGFAVSTRAGGYGAAALEAHLAAAAETLVIVQIEDAEAVPRSAEILAVDGVDAVLVGAADLALSLGAPGSPPRPQVEAAIDVVLTAAAGTGTPAIAVAGSGAEADRWRDRGVAVVARVATQLIHAAFSAAARETAPPGAAARAGDGDSLGTAASSRPSARADGVPREPLVLIPGMLGDATLWAGVLPALASHAAAQVARIDLDDSVAEMAASVLASAPPRFALAGHSLGAIVALEIVRQAPARVTRLALLNASARPASDAQLAAWAQLERDAEAGFGAFATTFARANLPAARRDERALVERVAAMAVAVGRDGLARQLAAQRTRPDNRDLLGRVAVPALVVSGALDEICPPPLQQELAAGIPAAQHVTIAAAGHMAALEQPTAVAERLVAWLDR